MTDLASSDSAKLGSIERAFNTFFGWLVRRGMGPGYARELEVPGRRSGVLRRTPVNLLEVEGRTYLVAPRGETQWVKNARAAGTVVLHAGRSHERRTVREVPAEHRAPILSAYLTRFRSQVARFFSIEAGSPLESFASIASRHPVFELGPADSADAR